MVNQALPSSKASERDRLIRLFESISEALCYFSLLLGVSVIVGWTTGIEFLKSFIVGAPAMKAPAAIGLVLLSVSLFLVHRKRMHDSAMLKLAWLLSSLAILIGSLVLLEYFSGKDLGIDRLVFKEASRHLSYPLSVRPSPVSAFNLVLVGCAILLLDAKPWKGVPPAHLLLLPVGVLSLLTFIGHLYSVPDFFSFPGISATSFNAAVGFLTICIAVLFARPASGGISIFVSETSGGVLIRRMLLVSVVSLLFLDYVVDLGEMEGFYDSHRGNAIHNTILISFFIYMIVATARKLEAAGKTQKQTESLLMESKERYRSLFESANDAIFVYPVRPDWSPGNFIEVNKVTCDRLGYTKEELHELSVLDISGRNAAIVNRAPEILKRLSTENSLIIESVHIARDGREIPVEVSSHYFSLGGAGAVISIARDITERKRAEEERNRFFTLPLDMMCVVGTDGYFKKVNAAFTRTLGYSEKELQEKAFIEFIHPDDRQASMEEVKKQLKGNATVDFENRYQCKDGSYRWLSWKVVAIVEEGLKYATVRDVTERKNIEESHKRKTEYLELLQNITIACNEAPTTGSAMQVFLDKICEYIGWPVGHVFIPNNSGKMVSSGIWHFEDETPFILFRKITDDTVFTYGEGLIGRVWQQRKLEWIPDVTHSVDFLRHDRAEKEHLDLSIKASFAFPVLEGENVAAILEFFSAQSIPPKELFLNLVTYLATELGRIMSKKKTEEQLARYSKKMEKALLRAEDVLNSLASTRDLIPYFTVSEPYLKRLTKGGGDNIRCVGFRSRYAAVYLHDVAGHDIEEILLNILATSLVDIYKDAPAKKSASFPSLFLGRINEHIRKFCEGTPEYISAVYGLMDFEEREVRLAVGGHPRPWLIQPDGMVREVEIPRGFILGQFDIGPYGHDRYSETVLKLEPGQLLLLYSDGLMDQPDHKGVRFEEKLLGGLGSRLGGLHPEAARAMLCRQFEEHLGTCMPNDDVSFIFIGTRPENEYVTEHFVPDATLIESVTGIKAEREQTSHPSSLARSAINSSASSSVTEAVSRPYEPIIHKLRENNWPKEKIHLVELALREMILNAIMHGNQCQQNFKVELTHILHSDILEISVADEGSGFDSDTLPQSIEDGMLEESGRGHHIISSIAENIYFNETGNRCWALFSKGSA